MPQLDVQGLPQWQNKMGEDARWNHDNRADFLTGLAMDAATDPSTQARAQVYATLALAERTAEQAAVLDDHLNDIRAALEDR